ncbi:MAG: M23 family metallopeptidase [Eubacteriales bacterium]|jgi:murein DD-endopeptidase MepM/ murein hydrolase activator NlpD|nr:M23 family metallopeptidase [Eubacteriales bacterium]
MDQRAKRKMAANAVYILTAVIVVSVLCMTLYTAFNSANRRAESDQPDISPDTEVVIESNVTAAPVDPSETESLLPAADGAEAVLNGEPADDGVPVSAPLYTPPTYIMPVNGVINKSYDDSAPVFSLTMNDYRVHTGIDLDAEIGCAVFACSDGVITNVYTDPFWGSCVTVSHGDGLTSHYMNLAADLPANVDEGVSVLKGDIIAATGDTALIEMADSNHLHFEMRVNGIPVNPLSYIPYEPGAEAVVNAE